MKKIIWIIVIIVVILGVVSWKQNQNATPVSGETIKIGALLPLTGALAPLGEDIRNSLELTRKQIFETSGIDFQIIYEDSAADTKVALPAVSKLIQIDKVPLIIAGPGSTANLAVAPIVEENKVIFIAFSATPKLNTAGSYIFKIIPDVNEEVILTAKKFFEEGARNVSLIYDNSADSNVVGKDIFIQTFKDLGGNNVSDQGYNVKTTNDFRTFLTKAKSENPDTIYFLGTDISTGIAVQQAKEMGIKQKIYGWSPAETDTFLKTSGDASEGFITTAFPFSCDGTQDMKKFCADYKQMFSGRIPISYSAHSYDLLHIIKNTIESNASKKLVKEEVQEALTSHSYKGISGALNFDENGNVVNKDFIFKIVKNAKFVPITQ